MRIRGSQEAVAEAGAIQPGAIENPGLRADTNRPQRKAPLTPPLGELAARMG